MLGFEFATLLGVFANNFIYDSFTLPASEFSAKPSLVQCQTFFQAAPALFYR
jgi:hypothetical protein